MDGRLLAPKVFQGCLLVALVEEGEEVHETVGLIENTALRWEHGVPGRVRDPTNLGLLALRGLGAQQFNITALSIEAVGPRNLWILTLEVVSPHASGRVER